MRRSNRVQVRISGGVSYSNFKSWNKNTKPPSSSRKIIPFIPFHFLLSLFLIRSTPLPHSFSLSTYLLVLLPSPYSNVSLILIFDLNRISALLTSWLILRFLDYRYLIWFMSVVWSYKNSLILEQNGSDSVLWKVFRRYLRVQVCSFLSFEGSD